MIVDVGELHVLESNKALLSYHRSPAIPKWVLLIFLLTAAFTATSGAQPEEYRRDSFFIGDLEQRHRLSFGFFSSGASSEDIDEDIFNWDYIVYSLYRFRLDPANRFRFRQIFWNYLSGGHRTFYELLWRHEYEPYHALSLSADFTRDIGGYEAGTLYAGYEGLLGKDLQWFVQGGIGMDSEHEYHSPLYLELHKPLSNTTLLRFNNEFDISTSGYRSNTLRIKLIQALNRRLAMNIGYRLFVNEQASGDVDDLTSQEISSSLVWQVRNSLFLIGTFQHYWNSTDVGMNTCSAGTQWLVSPCLSVLGNYSLEQFEGGPTHHAFRLGFSFTF